MKKLLRIGLGYLSVDKMANTSTATTVVLTGLLIVGILFVATKPVQSATPIVVTAKITGPSHVVIVFSEPVIAADTDFTGLTIDGFGPRNLSSIFSDSGTTTIEFDFDGDPVSTGATGNVNIASTVTDMSDPANPFDAGPDPSTILDDGQAPTLFSVSIASDNANSTLAKADNTVTLSFTSSEAVQADPVVFFASGGLAVTDTPVVTNTINNDWIATYIVNSSDTDGLVTFTIDFTDTAGNAGTQVTTDESTGVTVDVTVPTTPTIDAPTSPTSDNTPTITGTREDGATVVLTSDIDGEIADTSLVVGGVWSITPTTPLTYATHQLTAVQTDAAGNPSESSIQQLIVYSPDPTDISVETASDGSGTVVPAHQNLNLGTSITVYAISRDSLGNFVANVATDAWTLENITGGILDGDLVPAGDMKSAVLTGHMAGTASIIATSGSLNPIQSGTINIHVFLYANAVNYSAGNLPTSVYSADLDGDTDLDLAVTNRLSNNVSIFLNNGDGTFAAAVNYGVGLDPLSVFIADLNNDGNKDLAVANSSSGNVSILLGSGDGTFAAANNYSTDTSPMSVFAADLDGDLDLDLATANSSNDNVSILKNNGNGTFAAAVNYAAGDSAQSVFAADLDGDGDKDLVTANYEASTVSILLNNGNGTFAAANNYSTGTSTYSVFVADLDGDGDKDLVTANYLDDAVSILLNNGNGTFAAAVNYDTGSHPASVFAADLNGDTFIDLAVSNSYDHNVSILFGNGNGTFTPAGNYAVGSSPYSVFAGDFNGDGQIDLTTANLNGGVNDVSILFNLATDVDNIAPTVTKLGDDSTDVNLEVGDTNLYFSEALSGSSQAAVQNALIAGADKGLSYYWNDDYILTITATEATTFANDVLVSVADLTGNTATNLLIVDSALSSTQVVPDESGDVTINPEKPEVVIINPDQEVNITIDSGTTDPTINVSSLITNGAGTLPAINITSANANNTTVAIPDLTTVTSADSTWDGIIAAPTITTVSLPETPGQTTTLSTAVEVGFTGAKLSFDKAVRLLLPGEAGKRAGYIRTGISFTEITNVCAADDQSTGDDLATDSECKIDVGSDLVIWTKHFTSFATYTQTTITTTGGGDSGSGVVGGNGNLKLYNYGPSPVATSAAPGVAQPSVSGQASSPVFNKDLVLGNRSDDVKRLQQLLATDKSIYPEGLVTGYFGPLTQKAVRAFQIKYGLPQAGRVGPLTRAKLQEVFGSPDTSVPSVTVEQLQAMIDSLKQQIQELMRKR